jgi:cold-inducible RNA-binding protein
LKNIFVANLHFNTGEDELRQLFGQYGQVDRVKIMTDRDTGRARGFGFVGMANRGEGDNAIAALNGAQVGGRTLTVNEARPKVDRSGGNARRYLDAIVIGVAEFAEAVAGEEFGPTTILNDVTARSYGRKFSRTLLANVGASERQRKNQRRFQNRGICLRA